MIKDSVRALNRGVELKPGQIACLLWLARYVSMPDDTTAEDNKVYFEKLVKEITSKDGGNILADKFKIDEREVWTIGEEIVKIEKSYGKLAGRKRMIKTLPAGYMKPEQKGFRKKKERTIERLVRIIKNIFEVTAVFPVSPFEGISKITGQNFAEVTPYAVINQGRNNSEPISMIIKNLFQQGRMDTGASGSADRDLRGLLAVLGAS